MIISFEGIDDSGKSTLIKLLGKYIQSQDLKVASISELNTSHPINDAIKKNKGGNSFDRITNLLLIESVRRELYLTKVKPLLDQNFIVIYDRFIDSTIIYQGVIDGIDFGLIHLLNDLSTDDNQPSLTFFIDINYDVYKSRKVGDDYSEDNFNKMRQGYIDSFTNIQLNEMRPETTFIHCKVEDSNMTPEHIFDDQIKPVIDKMFGFIQKF